MEVVDNIDWKGCSCTGRHVPRGFADPRHSHTSILLDKHRSLGPSNSVLCWLMLFRLYSLYFCHLKNAIIPRWARVQSDFFFFFENKIINNDYIIKCSSYSNCFLHYYWNSIFFLFKSIDSPYKETLPNYSFANDTINAWRS